MSLDIALHRFVGGESSDAACEPALSILRTACQDPDGAYFDDINDVVLRDGSSIEMSAKGISSGDRFEGVGFFIRSGGCSPLAITLMFDLARASDMVIINTGGEEGNAANPFLILMEERQRGDMLPGWRQGAVLCESAQRLAEMIGISFDRWRQWAHPNQTAPT